MNTRTLVLLISHLLTCISYSASQEEKPPLRPTPSPKSQFIVSPANVTVLEGHLAILRCKIKAKIDTCQWFYLEPELDMFDESNTPKLVKQFTPNKGQDCSIKFNKTNMVQDGQWICKGLNEDARKYIISQPAFVEVLKNLDNLPPDENKEILPSIEDEDVKSNNTNRRKLKFLTTEEGHIVNTRQDKDALLDCQTNRALESCSWIRPDGTKLKLFADITGMYEIKGNLSDGNCSLLIHRVNAIDEGNWRCIVSTVDGNDRLGPLIHLHVLELGSHNGDHPGLPVDDFSSSSLVAILVATSLLLFFIIVILVFFMYRKRVWRKEPTHRYLEPDQVTSSEYALYGPSWVPGMPAKDQRLMDDSRYLDMTGNPSAPTENYVMFPASSVRSSSVSSRTTLSNIPGVGHKEDHSHPSARTSVHGSQKSISHDENHLLRKEDLERTLSANSDYEGNIYEEIPDNKLNPNDEHTYNNIKEDHEGYIIPKSVRTPDINISQPIEQNNSDTDSYDSPLKPPVPIRNDSANNPLSAYDVPTNSMKQLNIISV